MSLATLRGSLRVAAPTSAAHCLLDTRSAGLVVQVQLFRVDPLQHDALAESRGMSLEAVINRRVQPDRCCIAQRNPAAPSASAAPAANAATTAQADPTFSYSFEGLQPGRYHILAFTIDESAKAASAPTSASASGAPSSSSAAAAVSPAAIAAAAYTDPARQAFGFHSGSSGQSGGNGWPWALLEVGGGGAAAAASDGSNAAAAEAEATTIVPEFTLRVAHSFSVLRDPNSTVPTRTATASLRLLSASSGSLIPVLRLGASSARERGYNHGRLLAPYIVDFWRFYLFESRFLANCARYESFVARWVRPECAFFSYPASALEEAAGVVEGMADAGISMHLEELARDFKTDDVLAGYIETRSVVAAQSEHAQKQQQQQTKEPLQNASADPASSAASSYEDTKAKTLSHHCSQVVLWGSQTCGDGSGGGSSGGGGGSTVFAGRNMDGEIDIRKITASHSILIATERDAAPAAASASASSLSCGSADAAQSFRVISFMWPGLIGTLTGINETGLYICENAGESQPDTDLISGLTPVACVQFAALRNLDGRGLTPLALQRFLSRYISRAGWNHEHHCPSSAEDHAALLAQRGVPQYASDTQGGFSGPGSIFVVATPPVAAASKNSPADSSSDSSAVAAEPFSRPCHGFVVEADRCHTMLRLPSQAPPHDVADCILATNHALSLGYDDLGVLSRSLEALRAPTRAQAKCASLSPVFGGAAASGRQTNWNVPIAPKSYWRFEAGRNAIQALDQQRKRKQQRQAAVAAASQGTGSVDAPAPLGLSTVQHLLQVMCPGYTEHSFIGELRADGSVWVHVAVADLSIGQWAAPYAPWVSFEFGSLFEEREA